MFERHMAGTPSRVATAALCAIALLALSLVASLACALPAHALTYKYVAHKGNVGNPEVVENSLEAFRYAAEQAPTLYGIETDIFRTDNGDYICCHSDGNGDCNWGGTSLTSMSLAEIKRVTYHGCHVASMEEYLQACKDGGKWAYIQINGNCNSDTCLNEMLDIVADKELLGQCVFTGSRSNAVALGHIKQFSQERFGVDVLASSGSGAGDDRAGFDEALAGVRENGLDSVAVYANRGNRMAYAYSLLGDDSDCRLRAGGEGVGEDTARRLIEDYHVTCVYTKGFNPTHYTVSFVDADGKPMKTQVVGYRDAAQAPSKSEAEQHAKPGYDFVGWSTSFDEVTDNLTVEAQYKINTYTITYKAPAAWFTLIPRTRTYTTSDNDFATPEFKATLFGRSFEGWYDLPKGGTRITTFSPKLEARDVTLYARWEPALLWRMAE